MRQCMNDCLNPFSAMQVWRLSLFFAPSSMDLINLLCHLQA